MKKYIIRYIKAKRNMLKIIPITLLVKLVALSIVYGTVDLTLLLILSKTISALVGFSAPEVSSISTVLNRLSILQINTLLLSLFLIKIMSFKSIISVTQAQREKISTTVLEKYLNLDYESFHKKPAGDVHANVTSEVDQLIQLMFMPLSKGTMALVTVISILVYIAISDLSLGVFLIILALPPFLAISILVTWSIGKLSRRRAKANELRSRTSLEVIQNYVDLRMYGQKTKLLNQFFEYSKRYSDTMAKIFFRSNLTRFLIEFAVILTFATSMIVITNTRIQLDDTLITTLILIYRLVPSVQQLSICVNQVRSGADIISNFNKIELKSASENFMIDQSVDHTDNSFINLQNIVKTFDSGKRVTFERIEIRESEKVVIAGPSGSGKSTLLKIMSGLLYVDSGMMSRKDNLNITYVDQTGKLFSDSILFNVTFERDIDSVDMIKFYDALEKSCCCDFVGSGLYDVFDEIDIHKLSGGQIQRLNLARALYNLGDCLVLDEATSAVDMDTELKILRNLASLQTTVIAISHSVEAYRNVFDRVIMLK